MCPICHLDHWSSLCDGLWCQGPPHQAASGEKSEAACETVGVWKDPSLEGVMLLVLGALRQIGWPLWDPVSITDHRGKGIILTQGSLAKLRKLIHKASEDKLGSQFLDTGVEFLADQEDLGGGILQSRVKLGLRKAFTDGVVTTNKLPLARMGDKVSTGSSVCKQDEDFVFHRAWACTKRPGLETAVKAAMEPGDKSLLFNRESVHMKSVWTLAWCR